MTGPQVQGGEAARVLRRDATAQRREQRDEGLHLVGVEQPGDPEEVVLIITLGNNPAAEFVAVEAPRAARSGGWLSRLFGARG